MPIMISRPDRCCWILRGSKLIVAITVVTLPFIVPTASETTKTLRGKCHGGECIWFKPLSERILATSKKGTLVQVQVISGESDMGDPKERVRWRQKPYFIYAFCSTYLPTIMFADHADITKEYYVQVLPFHPDWLIPTTRMSSAVLYLYTCHKDLGDMDDKIMLQLGYDVKEEVETAIPKTLTSPTEILKY